MGTKFGNPKSIMAEFHFRNPKKGYKDPFNKAKKAEKEKLLFSKIEKNGSAQLLEGPTFEIWRDLVNNCEL